jgi:hypothetical protein
MSIQDLLNKILSLPEEGQVELLAVLNELVAKYDSAQQITSHEINHEPSLIFEDTDNELPPIHVKDKKSETVSLAKQKLYHKNNWTL